MLKERKQFIDFAKGIGIILVVLGHLDTGGQLSREMIYAFHMPLFFILSGIFAKTKSDYKSYLKKSFCTLYIPYLFFTVMDTVIFSALNLLRHQSVSALIKSNLFALIGFDFKVNNRPLWFLFALFVIRIAYYFIDKNKSVKYLSAILCVAFVFLQNSGVFSPLKNCVFIMAVPGLAFYIFGNLLGKYILNLDKIIDENKDNSFVRYILSVLSVIGLFVLLAFTAHANGSIDMTVYKFGNAVLYFMNAFIGSFAVLILSVLLSKIRVFSKPLIFYGSNSIIIMICHYYICRTVIPSAMSHFGLSDYIYHPITQLISLIAILLIMIPVIQIANRYFYFLFGKRK